MLKKQLFSVLLLLSIVSPFAVCAETESILQLSSDPRVEYGIGVLKSQLKHEKLAQEPYFIVGSKSQTPILKYLTEDELKCKALNTEEGFLVKRLSGSKEGTVIIAGADEQGSMYGCLDVAELLRIRGWDKLPPLYVSSPDIELRAYQFNFPTYVRGCSWDDNRDAADRVAPWFYDKEKIVLLLDTLAQSKFNAIHFEATHPFPAICNIPGYPEAITDVEEKTPLTRKKLENQRIPYLRWLFSECRRRNIVPYVGFFNVHVPDSVITTKKIIFEPRKEYSIPEIIKYNRAAIKAFSDTYGDLAGLFIWNGENVPWGNSGKLEEYQHQNRWARDAIVAGLLESSNRPPCILWTISGFMDREGFEELLTSYPQLHYLATDHDGENTTAPDLHHIYIDFLRPFKGIGGVKGTITYSNMGGWGSGNIIPYPWFSNNFLKSVGRHLVKEGIVGSTSQPMRAIWYPDYHERDWLFIKGLGKFLWDSSDAHVQYFNNSVKDRYGCSEEDADAILRAYEEASQIPILWASQFNYGVCSVKAQFGATLINGIWGGDIHIGAPGMLLFDGINTKKLPGYTPEWIKPAPWTIERGKMVDIVEYVKGDTKAEITPDKLADMLANHAKLCFENINKVSEVTLRKSEFEELKLNLYAYNYMGLHMSEKIKALLDMLRFLRGGDLGKYNSGKAHLKKSFDYFLEQRAVSQKVYPNPDLDLLLPSPGWSVRHEWDSVLPILRDEIDNYDNYLVMLAMHLAADRKNMPYPGGALTDFYRRVSGVSIDVYRPWLPDDPKDYWLTDPPKSDATPWNPLDDIK